jgi:cytochrome c biogenesis protein CcdA
VTGAEGLAAAFIGGVLTSASPCVLAAVPVAVGFVGGQAVTPRRSAVLALAFVAGMNIALLAMGLAAARLGLLLGTLPGPWSVAVGLLVVGLAVWLWRSQGAACGITLPAALQQRLAASGLWGAVLLGGLIGTVMSPCATPALAAALALAGSGSAFGVSMWWGAALLLAYGIGHSLLLGAAGAMPGAAMALVRHFASAAASHPELHSCRTSTRHRRRGSSTFTTTAGRVDGSRCSAPTSM